MLPRPFQNTREFRAAFVRDLGHMLGSDELGAFILVLANASYDPEIYRLLRQRLQVRFDHWQQCFLAADLRGEPLGAAPDDEAVFRRLMEVGCGKLQLTALRDVGPWRLQYNQLRSFRPSRMSNEVVQGISKPFDPTGFHFNKPFLRKEILWEGELLNRRCRLLYNKFPFAELHGLLAIDPEQEKAQFLEREDHHYLWRLAELLGAAMPDVGFAYNSYGAYASVNHQHFQMYVWDDGSYPIEAPQWQHNGGGRRYPLAVQRFADAKTAWLAIDRLHAEEQSFNLLYRPGLLYLVPRARQGSHETAPWSAGFAWSEVCGLLTTASREQFEQLDEAQLTVELARLRQE